MPITRAYAQAAEPGNFFVAGKNKVINGDFNIWQRGTSFSTGNGAYVYSADRWAGYFYASNATTMSQQAFTAGSAPVAGYEAQYFLRISSTSNSAYLIQRIEDVRTLAGQTVTLSFWAKSASNQTLSAVELLQDFGTGGSSAVNTALTPPSITTSWARYTFTTTLPSISGKTIGTGSNLTIGIRGAINNALDIWGVQLEAGAVATPFTTATGTLAGELAACQRYYFKVGPGTENNAPIAMGMFNSAGTSVQAQVYFPQQLRIKPSSIDSLNLRAQDISNGYAMTSVTLDASSSASAGRISATVSGATAFRSCFIDGGTGAGYLAFNAEL
jgi:hypothetical protein